jgi:hypothetical protein
VLCLLRELLPAGAPAVDVATTQPLLDRAVEGNTRNGMLILYEMLIICQSLAVTILSQELNIYAFLMVNILKIFNINVMLFSDPSQVER